MKYIKTYESRKKEPSSYIVYTAKDDNEQALIDILKQQGFDVMYKSDDPSIRFHWLLRNGVPVTSVRAFNTGFLLNALKKLDPSIAIPTMDALIDYFLPRNPQYLDNLLPYMSGHLKHKYRSMIKGKQFDL